MAQSGKSATETHQAIWERREEGENLDSLDDDSDPYNLFIYLQPH
jgi:hypothetical protein